MLGRNSKFYLRTFSSAFTNSKCWVTDCLWAEGIQYWECKPIYTFSSPSSDKLLCPQIGNQAREEAPLFQVSFKRPPKPRSSKYQPPLYKPVSRLLWLLGSCWAPCSAAQPGVMTGCFLSLHLPPHSSPPPVTSTSSTDLPLTCPPFPGLLSLSLLA